MSTPGCGMLPKLLWFLQDNEEEEEEIYWLLVNIQVQGMAGSDSGCDSLR